MKSKIQKTFKYLIATSFILVNGTLGSLYFLPSNLSRELYLKLCGLIDRNSNELYRTYNKYLLTSFLLKVDCLPKSEYKEGKLTLIDTFKIDIFDKSLTLPFGVSSDYDFDSSSLYSLENKIGFDLIESGTCIEDDKGTYKKTQAKIKTSFKTEIKDDIIFDYSSPPSSVVTSNIFNIQKYLNKRLKDTNNTKVPLIGLNFKVSDKLSNLVPYLLDDILISNFNKIIGNVDFITLDLSKVNALSYKRLLDPVELDKLLKKISNCVNEQYKTNQLLIEDNKFPFLITNTTLPKILIKFNFNHVNTDEEKEKIVNTMANNPIIYGIILDNQVYNDNEENKLRIVKNSQMMKDQLLSQLKLIHRFKIKNNTKLKVITNDNVSSGDDIKRYYDNGADYVLINSLLYTEGPYVVDRLIKELNNKQKNI